MRTWIALLTAVLTGCLTGCATTDFGGERAHDAPATDRAEHAESAVKSVNMSPRTAPGPTPLLPAVPLVGLGADARPTLLTTAAGGKPALVTFWATWCEACLKEIDALNRLDARARSTGGVVIGVAVGEPRDKAALFVKDHGLTYAQLVDEKLALADALGQKRLPATLVLDREGRVVFVGGALDERALEAFRGAMAR